MLYKYTSIQNFKRFIEVITDRKLYAALYTELNDPMEGAYVYPQTNISDSFFSMLKSQKQQTRICSLSREESNQLMWAHYADGHRGVVLGVEIDRHKYDVVPVIYTGSPISVIDWQTGRPNGNKAKDILSRKLNIWEYEKEERVLTNNKYVTVKIEKVILGSRMQKHDKQLIHKIVKHILPRALVVNSNIKEIV